MRTFAAFLFIGLLGASSASACDARKARFAVGASFSPALAERARTAARAATVRRMMLGMAYTMQFNGARLNLRTDPSGKIVGAACG